MYLLVTNGRADEHNGYIKCSKHMFRNLKTENMFNYNSEN